MYHINRKGILLDNSIYDALIGKVAQFQMSYTPEDVRRIQR